MSRKMRKDSLKSDIIVYAVILAIAGQQIMLAYRGGTVAENVSEMVSLAIIQAALGIVFFMHLLQEKRSLILVLVPATLFVLLIMNAFWSDSFRIIHMRPWPD